MLINNCFYAWQVNLNEACIARTNHLKRKQRQRDKNQCGEDSLRL